MKNHIKTNTHQHLKKLLAAAAMGAFIAVPLFGEVSVSEAQNPTWGNRAQYQTFTGIITTNPNNDRFDIRVGNDTYNVFPSSRLPDGLREGDTIRVYGERSGTNDIRNASVARVDGRTNGRWDDRRSNQPQTLNGTVLNVRSNQRFDLRVGNTTYDVHTSNRLPGNLNRGDEVRVYGVLRGNNEIRNASVARVDGRTDGRWGDRRSEQPRTLSGTVLNVRSNQRFDLRVGNTTYDVHTSNRLPGNLNRGDEVRVYGVLRGNNEIRNANVNVIRRGSNRGRNDNQFRTFNGTVVNVVSEDGFDMRVGNTTHRVYSTPPMARSLNRGDQVRVYGVPRANNIIRNANVTVTRRGNTGWDNRRGQDQYQTFTGRVVRVNSDQSFEFRDGNTTYNVHSSSRLPNMQVGNVVRVYGIRSGNNDIRNANVAVVDSRGGNQAQRANQATTIDGTVVNVESNNRFTMQSGRTVFTVHASSNLPRNLRRGDSVRVIGLRDGNQIRNASVSVTGRR